PKAIPLLDTAIAKETDAGLRKLMEEARAVAVLKSDLPEGDKLDAIAILRTRGDQDTMALLSTFAATAEGKLKEAAESAVSSLQSELAVWGVVQNVIYGLSLGSVLLLAAIGLAITFGVMGVINMAHGEMVMLGAYTTYVVQNAIRAGAPELFDWSLIIALPFAFIVAGIIGILIERTIIRF